MKTLNTLIITLSTAFLVSCGVSADEVKQPTKLQTLKATALHEGLSMGLELKMESEKRYRVSAMTKNKKGKYIGTIVAQSGKAYKASCGIKKAADILFSLPCKLTLIKGDK